MRASFAVVLMLIVSTSGGASQNAPANPALVQRFVDAPADAIGGLARELSPDDASAVRSALQDIAIAHTREGRQREALRVLDVALTLSARERAPRGRLNVLLTLSQAHGIAGSYDEAVRVLEEVIATSDADNEDMVAAAANNLGNVYRRRGQLDLALDSYQRSLASNQAAGRDVAIARTLNNIGVVHQQRGDFRTAVDYYLQSLEIKERIGPAEDVTSTLGNIGGVYALQGNGSQAIDYLERAYALAEKSNNVRAMITNAANLGRVLMTAKRFSESESRLTRARELAETAGYDEPLAATLNGLGNLAIERRQFAIAATHLSRAQAIYDQLRDPLGTGQVLLSQAKIDIERGRVTAGIGLAEKARDAFKTIGRPTALLDAEVLLGETYAAQRQWTNAIATYQRAIELSEQGLDVVAGDAEDRFGYLEMTAKAHSGLAHAYAATGRGADALAAAERGRARSLLDMLSGEPADGHLTDAERARRIELDTALNALNDRVATERARARSGNKPDPRLSAELERVRRSRDEFYLGLDASHPRLNLARGRAPVLAADQIAAALPPRSGLIEFLVGDRGSWIILLVPRQQGAPPRLIVRPATIPSARLTSLAAEFTRQVATRDLAFSANARALYDAVLGPIDAEISALDHVIVVPHGALWDVPFQALQTPRQKFLIEEHAISYAPSASTLKELQRRAKPRAARPRVLAFGDPRLARSSAPLPNAAREAREVAAIYGEGSLVATDAEASESRFRQAAPHADIIHIATHGVLDNVSPMFSYVSLAGSGTQAASDGRLEGRELINMQLDAELIVLSACETARGRVANGEGVVGLSWALFAAGASSAAVSLWPVDSASTTALMAEFHRQRKAAIAQSAAPTAHAMRAAQQSLLSRVESRHPFYWAGFVVIGVP